MTLEEIKARIKTYHDIAEQELAIAKNERGFHYLDGKASAYRKCMDLLDQLEPTWHPYPAEKPTEKDGYVVSVVDESNGYCFTDASFYHPNLDRFEIDDVYQLHVYAWAERPKPYKKEASNDN